MVNRAKGRLDNLGVGDFSMAVKVLEYDDSSNSFSTVYNAGYKTLADIIVAINANSINLGKKDIIEVYFQSENDSMLASIANFGMFGGSGNSELKYSSFREEIVRNDPS